MEIALITGSAGLVGAEAVRFLAKKRGRLEDEIPVRKKYDN